MMILFRRPMLPAQFGMQFVLRISVQLAQLLFDNNSRYVLELFSLWLQERMVNRVEATGMEVSVPRVDIIYLFRETNQTCNVYT